MEEKSTVGNDEEDRSMEELSDSLASCDAESLLSTLVCSSRLDSMNPPWKRKARASEITTVLSSSENRRLLVSLSNNLVISSQNGYIRMCHLLVNAVVMEDGEVDVANGLAETLCRVLLHHLQLYHEECNNSKISPSLLEVEQRSTKKHTSSTILFDVVEKHFHKMLQEKQYQQRNLALSDLFLSIAKAASSSDEIGAMIYAPALSVANFLVSLHDEKDSSKAQRQEIYSILDQKLSTIRRKEEVFIITKLVDQKLRQELLRYFEKKLLSNPETFAELAYNFLSSLPATEDKFSDDEQQILQNLQLTAIRHLVRGTSSSSLLFARRILLSIVLLYQQESFLYRYIDELVRALVSSIDLSQIITTPGQRQAVYETLNQIAELLLADSLEKDEKSKGTIESSSSVLACVSCLLSTKDQQQSTTKEYGCRALASWYALSLLNTENGPATQGMIDAIAFVRGGLINNDKVAATSAATAKEFRFRTLPFVVACQRRGAQLRLIDSIFSLDNKEDNVWKSLISIIELCLKKQNAMGVSAVQLDGILAMYMCLERASSTDVNLIPSSLMKQIFLQPSFLHTAIVLPTAASANSISDSGVLQLIPLCLELACRPKVYTNVKSLFSLSTQEKQNNFNAPARTLVACAIHPWSNCSIRQNSLNCINTILCSRATPQEKVILVDALVYELYSVIDQLSKKKRQDQEHLKMAESYRDQEAKVAPTWNDIRYYNEKAAHDISFQLAKQLVGCVHKAHRQQQETAMLCFTHCLLVMHISSDSLMSENDSPISLSVLLKNTKRKRRGPRQQKSLVKHTIELLEEFFTSTCSSISVNTFVGIFLSILGPACCNNNNSQDLTSDPRDAVSLAIFSGAILLLKTFGVVASIYHDKLFDLTVRSMTYEFVSLLVKHQFPKYIANQIFQSTKSLNLLTEEDIALYRSPDNAVFLNSIGMINKAEDQKKVKSSSKHRSEEEEWEEQVKKELEEKKAKSIQQSTIPSTSKEDQKLLLEQQKKRKNIGKIIEQDYPRSLSAVCALLCSVEEDVSIANDLLPCLAGSVLFAATSNCPAKNIFPTLRTFTQETLRVLASCVAELDDSCAFDVAQCLVACVTNVAQFDLEKIGDERRDARTVVAFHSPSSSAAAARVICEIDAFGEALSGPSFWFVFPIIRAVMSGPRAIPGCGAVLEILQRHLPLVTADDQNVVALRRDISTSLLELLSYDRSLTFHDPNPCQSLVCLYEIAAKELLARVTFSLGDFSPLLGDIGALGCKNCRLASMLSLGAIFKAAILQGNPLVDILQGDPIVESRVWFNCFDKMDSDVRSAARDAWISAHPQNSISAGSELQPPSKLYALPLMPLLSHKNPEIRPMAADAFAYAMGMHPNTSVKAILRLCTTYIDSFPKVTESKVKSISSTAATVSKPITKSAVKSKPKPAPSVIAMIGSGKPVVRKVAKKTTVVQPIAKQRPVLSQEELESQFFGATPKDAVAEVDSSDKVQVRLGIMNAITSIGKERSKVELDLSGLRLLVGFLLAFAIADPNDQVCSAARNALKDVVAMHGGTDEAIQFLLPSIEGVLIKGDVDESYLKELPLEKLPCTILSSDKRKEGAVIALGSVALHLNDETNVEKIDSTLEMLIAALRTPSEDVQASVTESLSKLMKKGRIPDRIEGLISQLIEDCLNGNSYAIRRGAAYGISAVVKGSGISCLKKYDLVKKLEVACTSGSPNAKEGSLCAIELLCSRLGLLFEPYVIVLLPALLKAFGDSNDYVRNAASTTAGLIMSKLSSHGVKLVMPAILDAFDEQEWRTKQASIMMLGAMSQLAPNQLASSLPKIVPKLSEAFADTHPKVKASAEQSFSEITKVIKNPEIASLSTILVRALTDPSNETKGALEALIETEFLHTIDAPSLALIVPVVYRGLRDRSASSKRYAALIAGNMCTMISDPRDLNPYIHTLLPGLKLALLDPIPDVRSTAAKALGSLARGLGESSIPDLQPWLISVLKGDTESSVERSGAAQGLIEVLMACGHQVVDSVMLEDIFPLIHHPKAGTREGALWVLQFLPLSLGQSFIPLIDASLPVLLSGLADDHESVRYVALRAGRVLIRCHGKAHSDTILPSLEEGLCDSDWHIRLSSITLLGDLLSMIGGTKVVTGDADTQEDIRQAERAQAQLALTLGASTRKRVLSRVYIARSDSAVVVRQMAVQVWKTVVSVTGRTLRDILQTLVSHIVVYLASGDHERTEVGGRCLGDVVNKLGDAVLPEIVPVLRDSLYRGDVFTRKGACVGLSEVISSSTKEHINKFLDIIIKAVQDALCDDDEGVRKMASGCFQNLYSLVGPKALDEVLPALLVAMRDDSGEAEKERAIQGLIGILSVRSRELLPFLIPRLVSKPVSISRAKALGTISLVTKSTIISHLSSIIPSLIFELSEFTQSSEFDRREVAIRDCARSICTNVDAEGINTVVSEIASKCGNDKYSIRMESCWMLGVLVEQRKDKADFYGLVPVILRELLYRMNDDKKEVLVSANKSMTLLTNCVPAEELVNHIEFCRNMIASIVSDARRRKGGVGDGEFLMPGFNIPNGLDPLLPIYQRGILYGDSNIREVAACGLGESIAVTDSKFLAGPFVIKMTGPLLRIVGDRNPSNVKVAIIRTLGLILQKGGPALRAFAPQFQTTFVKALTDPSRQVRMEATKALALLMPLSTRVDPLIKELATGSLGKGINTTVESAGILAIQTATLEALETVLKYGGSKAKLQDTIPTALETGKDLVLSHPDDGVREAAAKVIAAACQLLGAAVASDVCRGIIINSVDYSSEAKHGKACTSFRILYSSVGKEIDNDVFLKMAELLQSLTEDGTSNVREAACVALGAAIGSSKGQLSIEKSIEGCLLKCMESGESIEIHKAVARGLCVAVRMKPMIFRGKSGLPIMNSALRLAMSVSQRVQLPFNDFLWLALAMGEGEEGLRDYETTAMFENVKTMRSLANKVLSKMKEVPEENFV